MNAIIEGQVSTQTIIDSELRIESDFRTPRAGMQPGKIPVGILVTHIPTGITAFCDSEHTQINNLRIAKAMIEYGLAEMNWNRKAHFDVNAAAVAL